MKYFTIDKAMSSKKNEYMVWFKEGAISRFYPIQGSLSVMQARIMGLSYPDFLRFVRDTYNARLGGIGRTYVSFYFPDENSARKYANMLDKRFEEIITKI